MNFTFGRMIVNDNELEMKWMPIIKKYFLQDWEGQKERARKKARIP
jgi:hypothetical protein